MRVIEHTFDFIVHNLFTIIRLFVHKYYDTIISSNKSNMWC